MRELNSAPLHFGHHCSQKGTRTAKLSLYLKGTRPVNLLFLTTLSKADLILNIGIYM